MDFVYYGVYFSSIVLVFVLFVFLFCSYKISFNVFWGVLFLFVFFSLRFLNEFWYFLGSKFFFTSIFMILWFIGMFLFIRGGSEVR